MTNHIVFVYIQHSTSRQPYRACPYRVMNQVFSEGIRLLIFFFVFTIQTNGQVIQSGGVVVAKLNRVMLHNTIQTHAGFKLYKILSSLCIPHVIKLKSKELNHNSMSARCTGITFKTKMKDFCTLCF